MLVQVLGPTRCLDEAGQEHALGARKPRSVLAALTLHRGDDVAAGTLADLVWGGRPPAGAHGTLHSYVSVLRRALGPDAEVLETTDQGYRLRLVDGHVDAEAFSRAISGTHRLLAPLEAQLGGGTAARWPSYTEVTTAVQQIDDALGWWRGVAYADLPDHPDLDAARSALAEWRTTAELDRALGLLALGDHATCLVATEPMTVRYPFRERTWALHALALSRLGRPADALAALREARRVLADELGLDPGPELRELEQALLRQDPLPGPVPRAAAPRAVEPRAPRPAITRPSEGWPTVGRADELAQVGRALDDAESGRLRVVQLTGEAGVGKSHLVAELLADVRGRGLRAGVGRCSQDDGAPPLWPWRSALADLGAEVPAPVATGTDRGEEPTPEAAFRTWDAIANAVVGLTREAPAVLVFEDLHWADTATLRALRHLVSTVPMGTSLLLVVTRRPAEALGELGSLVEAMARRHALPLVLEGLSEDASADLLAAVAGDGVGAGTARRWHARSAGNPFFLIELARLADGPEAVPDTVRDVVQRRLRDLPQATQELLVVAAVVGRRFPLDLAAAVAGATSDEADAALDEARQAGLVHDVDGTWLSFAHALTRDAVVATATPARQERLHARIAHALEQGGTAYDAEQRVSELALHWTAAGAAHASLAWRAASAAAAQARQRFARAEASAWMEQAVVAHRRDPSGGWRERYDLLLARAHDHQVDGEWTQVHALVAEAVALARAAGDAEALVRAAAVATRDSVWLPLPWFEVDEDVVDDLRWALRDLPERDSQDRCHGMVSLAVQLYYDPSAVAEAEALVDEGLAMARRLDDPALLWWAARAAGIALWRPGHAERRHELSTGGVAAARASGDAEAEPVALVVAAGDAFELGDRQRFEALAAEAEEVVRRRRNDYALIALSWMWLSLAVMRGDEDETRRRSAELIDLGPRSTPFVDELHRRSVRMTPLLWSPELLGTAEHAQQAAEVVAGQMGRDVVCALLARSGALDALREQLRTPVRHRTEAWNASSTAALMAEAAAVAGDPAEAAFWAGRLAPLRGRMSVAGYSVAYGPTDGYLALALAATGDTVGAGRAADDASALAHAWDLDRYVGWLDGHRRSGGY